MSGSKSLIETGDIFTFNGLVGSTQSAKRQVQVIGISVTGRLSFFMTVDGDAAGIAEIPYREALGLMEENIWQYDGKVGS